MDSAKMHCLFSSIKYNCKKHDNQYCQIVINIIQLKYLLILIIVHIV